MIDMLQDFSFRKSYFRKIMKHMYAASIFVFVLTGLLSISLAFAQGTIFGLFTLVLAPMAVLLAIAFVRVSLETMQSLMQASSYVKEITKHQRLATEAARKQAESFQDHDQRRNLALLKQTGF